MIAKINSGALRGVDGYGVSAEVDISQGLPSFDIVGLPGSAVRESKERVRSAVKNSGIAFPVKKITINLAPADTKKEGPAFDLPIAVGILCAMGELEYSKARGFFFAGELSLDGGIKPVRGILPMVHGAFSEGIRDFVVPAQNAVEAALVEGANVYGAGSLKELLRHFKGEGLLPVVRGESPKSKPDGGYSLDFSDVKGQESVKRALEIAAAGYHNIIMIGPPGSGKTMMAKRLPGIMPDISFDESVEVTKIYSVSGLVDNKSALVKERPFRAPHHTISYSAMTGGGSVPKPGELSLAHKGVLFLDELPEFHRDVLEVMRQPLEDKYVNISRALGVITYPSDFLLAAAMNPCPCGNLYSNGKCSCTQGQISKYLSKISGPLLDRIDIQAETAQINYKDLRPGGVCAESSETIKSRVMKAVEIQKSRYKGTGLIYNSQLPPPLCEKYCALDATGERMLRGAFNSMGLSVRAYHKILKLSRTIADLENEEKISPVHLAEAIQYRGLDRKYWG